VEIESRSPHVDAVALRGPDASALLASVAVPDGVIVARNDWRTGPGLDVWYEPTAERLVTDLIAAGAVEVDADAFEALRIEAGVPRQGFDIDETTIAQEAFLERDAVSFTKGCFLGQELVCRIDTRGHVNRLLRRVRATVPLARGSAVIADGKDVGMVTSVAGTLGLATIRRTVEPGAEVLIRTGTAEAMARVEAVDT
jgi:folate-binding protein YgfZ